MTKIKDHKNEDRLRKERDHKPSKKIKKCNNSVDLESNEYTTRSPNSQE